MHSSNTGGVPRSLGMLSEGEVKSVGSGNLSGWRVDRMGKKTGKRSSGGRAPTAGTASVSQLVGG